MAFIWFLGGIVLVTAVYFLTGESLDPWPALDAATIVGGVYLLSLVIYTTRKPFPLRSRIVSILLCAGVLFAAG